MTINHVTDIVVVIVPRMPLSVRYMKKFHLKSLRLRRFTLKKVCEPKLTDSHVDAFLLIGLRDQLASFVRHLKLSLLWVLGVPYP